MFASSFQSSLGGQRTLRLCNGLPFVDRRLLFSNNLAGEKEKVPIERQTKKD